MKPYGAAAWLCVIMALPCQGGRGCGHKAKRSRCDIISGNKGQFCKPCECGTCCDRSTWRGAWNVECGVTCRNEGCPDFAEDAMLFAIFVAVLVLPCWIPAVKSFIMPLTRGERASNWSIVHTSFTTFAMLFLPFNIGINGLIYGWTVLVSPVVVFAYYAAVKRRSGFWPPRLANATECAAVKDAEGLPIQEGDPVTYCTKKELHRVWLVELYSSGEWRVRESQDRRAVSLYFKNEAKNIHKGHSWMPPGDIIGCHTELAK